jgi:hypothetical protein
MVNYPAESDSGTPLTSGLMLYYHITDCTQLSLLHTFLIRHKKDNSVYSFHLSLEKNSHFNSHKIYKEEKEKGRKFKKAKFNSS